MSNPKIFIGHCFFDKNRVIKYQKTMKLVFKKTKYDLAFGITGTIRDDEIKNISSLVDHADYCIYDLMGHSADKYKLNLNVILELGISIGASKKYYVMCPEKEEYRTVFQNQLSNLKYKIPREYEIDNKKSFLKALGDIKKIIDEDWLIVQANKKCETKKVKINEDKFLLTAEVLSTKELEVFIEKACDYKKKSGSPFNYIYDLSLADDVKQKIWDSVFMREKGRKAKHTYNETKNSYEIVNKIKTVL